MNKIFIAAAFACVLVLDSFGGDPKKSADVLGRDLNIPGAGFLGHVGLWTGSAVLEVLTEGKIIFDDHTLSSFKTKTKFWGSRFKNDAKDFRAVITTGRDQMKFSPQYTFSATYQIGRSDSKLVWNAVTKKFDQKTVITPAKFRCDTFVFYCYYAAASIDFSSSGWISPAILYNNVPNSR